ncbi:molybdopterin-guanine dinucleotide biosynthesis protein B [Desulfotomaculum copahuensis]|uniref:Molybdopterin-guanine dinucleotide biosynthesis protein B n=1 Tax=Desulfotomaculum copahuensis TaxID=1838280 RepID=A0A1B7LFB4_9FIRM|nr:molybdopterin-guanine dinucleotide biosynthesis protein B [Desulfotomaculum copahuensis]OAT82319.1 molybdopterin-guanine dinucleotide biosynthesis protein B [Desulfotomaculum copahuensis]
MENSKVEPPVICVVGTANTGKTTFLEKLIVELKGRGCRVGAVKHHHRGDFEIDRPGKDTWRFACAGADAVCISAPRKAAVIRRVADELMLEEIVPLLGAVDLVLAEGFKKAGYPQIEVCPPDGCTELVGRPDQLIALIGDYHGRFDRPRFAPGEVAQVADFILGWSGR